MKTYQKHNKVSIEKINYTELINQTVLYMVCKNGQLALANTIVLYLTTGVHTF